METKLKAIRGEGTKIISKSPLFLFITKETEDDKKEKESQRQRRE